jgi:hypothetical protein
VVSSATEKALNFPGDGFHTAMVGLQRVKCPCYPDSAVGRVHLVSASSNSCPGFRRHRGNEAMGPAPEGLVATPQSDSVGFRIDLFSRTCSGSTGTIPSASARDGESAASSAIRAFEAAPART